MLPALIVFLPLLAAIIAGLFVRVIPARLAQLATTGALLVSAFLSALVFQDVALAGHAQKIIVLPWIQSGDLAASWTLRSIR